MKVGLIAMAAVGVLGLILLLFSMTCVPAGNRGIVTYFGRVSGTALPEGLSLVAPWANVHDRSIRQERMDGTAPCFSSDLQTVQIAFAVLFRQPEGQVVNLYQLYKDPWLLIEPRIQECLKQITANYPAQELVRKRDAIRMSLIGAVRGAIGELVQIDDILLINIDLTDELEKAIERKMVMEQASLEKSFELERERKTAEITVVRAKAEAEAVQLVGASLRENPTVIDMEVVKRWNGVSPQTLLVGQSGGASVVYPIGK